MKKQQKENLREYLTNNLEQLPYVESCNQTNNSILVNATRKNNVFPIEILIQEPFTEKKYLEFRRNIIQNNRYEANIFYKDGISSHVRLGRRGNIKQNKSLSNYSPNEINQMIHLRKMEKKILSMQNNNILTWFQPETERMSEGIRNYELLPVYLNYDHVMMGDKGYGFVSNQPSIDFRIPREIENCELGLTINENIKRAYLFKIK